MISHAHEFAIPGTGSIACRRCARRPRCLSACGGGGGGGGQPPPASVTISGQITFDRIPFDADARQRAEPGRHGPAPARQVTVQAIAAAGGCSARLDHDGYQRQLFVERAVEHEPVHPRARRDDQDGRRADLEFLGPQQRRTRDALYALDGDRASSGTANSTRNLNAPSGFGVTSYTGERAAAPFAILDTVFRAKELVLTAAPTTAFPALSLFWSDQNRPTAGRFCPDDGDIGTSSYIVFAAGRAGRLRCAADQPRRHLHPRRLRERQRRHRRVRPVGDRARVRPLLRGSLRALRFHRRRATAAARPARSARGLRRRLGQRVLRHGARQPDLSRFAATACRPISASTWKRTIDAERRLVLRSFGRRDPVGPVRPGQRARRHRGARLRAAVRGR